MPLSIVTVNSINLLTVWWDLRVEVIQNTAMKAQVYIFDLRVVVPALDQTIRVGMLEVSSEIYLSAKNPYVRSV